MPYSNDLEQIRNGLVNYIGAAQAAVPYEGRAKNQIVASILVDEVLSVARTEDGPYCDPYVLVPMFKGIIGVLKQQQYKAAESGNKEAIMDMEAAIELFQAMIKKEMPETKGA